MLAGYYIPAQNQPTHVFYNNLAFGKDSQNAATYGVSVGSKKLGRHFTYQDLESYLTRQLTEHKFKRHPSIRQQITELRKKFCQSKDIKSEFSKGWLDKFCKRHKHTIDHLSRALSEDKMS